MNKEKETTEATAASRFLFVSRLPDTALSVYALHRVPKLNLERDSYSVFATPGRNSRQEYYSTADTKSQGLAGRSKAAQRHPHPAQQTGDTPLSQM
jgi:hypothetical protein